MNSVCSADTFRGIHSVKSHRSRGVHSEDNKRAGFAGHEFSSYVRGLEIDPSWVFSLGQRLFTPPDLGGYTRASIRKGIGEYHSFETRSVEENGNVDI